MRGQEHPCGHVAGVGSSGQVAEQLCLTGHAELALGYFQRAADTALIDLEWIDRCPALVPLRALPGFAEGRRKVRTRVEAIWTA